tara:strand:+ start:1817 stop:2098 length:282 start_codon:yes stop_codon:yes gene_type:complete
MSEEQTKETTQVVNNELTERVNNAFIANNYTLLNGGSDNVVMIRGDKKGSLDGKNSVDMLLTLEGMEEAASSLRTETETIQGPEEKTTNSNEE